MWGVVLFKSKNMEDKKREDSLKISEEGRAKEKF